MKTLFCRMSLFAVLVFTFAACKSGGGSSDPPPSNQEPVPEPVPQPEPVKPTLTFSAGTPVLQMGITAVSASVELTWSGTNLVSCTASSSPATGWSGTKSLSGNEIVDGLVGSSGTLVVFYLDCQVKDWSIPLRKMVMVQLPMPPPPPPEPISVAMDCDGIGGFVHRNTTEYVSVGNCVLSAPKAGDKFALKDIRGHIAGPLASSLKGMRLSLKDASNVASNMTIYGSVAGGNVSFAMNFPADGQGAQKIDVSVEMMFEGIPPLDSAELYRYVSFTLDADQGITVGSVTDVPVVISSVPANPRIGYARVRKGMSFYPKNNEVFRRDMEMGNEVPITYTYSSRLINSRIVSSNDGKRIMTDIGNVGVTVFDTDGPECSFADLSVCNKGMKGVFFHQWPNTSSDFSSDGKFVSYSAVIFPTVGGEGQLDLFISKIDEPAYEVITKDAYHDFNSLVASGGIYFYSCRPKNPSDVYAGGCGMFWIGVDFTTGKPIDGTLKPIIWDATWEPMDYSFYNGLGKVSLSLDEKELLFPFQVKGKHRFGSVYVDMAPVTVDSPSFKVFEFGRSVPDFPEILADGSYMFAIVNIYLPVEMWISVVVDPDGSNALALPDGINRATLIP